MERTKGEYQERAFDELLKKPRWYKFRKRAVARTKTGRDNLINEMVYFNVYLRKNLNSGALDDSEIDALIMETGGFLSKIDELDYVAKYKAKKHGLLNDHDYKTYSAMFNSLKKQIVSKYDFLIRKISKEDTPQEQTIRGLENCFAENTEMIKSLSDVCNEDDFLGMSPERVLNDYSLLTEVMETMSELTEQYESLTGKICFGSDDFFRLAIPLHDLFSEQVRKNMWRWN